MHSQMDVEYLQNLYQSKKPMLQCKKCDVLWSKVPRDEDYMDVDATIKLYKTRKCPDCGSRLDEVTIVTGLSP